MDLRDKVILAPMVRASTLPLRLLSLEYGADVVFGEEIVDKKIPQCKRIYNPILQTVDYMKDHIVSFRTHASEREKLVFQLGTSSAEGALKAAEILVQDVNAFDINMGCPKHFSISGGMGASLLKKPEVAADIISTLKRNLNVPVSCKIRLFSKAEETVDFARKMEAAGAHALTVHCRTVDERPKDAAHWIDMKPVVDALSIPVICNGDVQSLDDVIKCKEITNCSSAMIARAALLNPSVFRKQGLLDPQEAYAAHMKKCIEWDEPYQVVKNVYLRYIVAPASPFGMKIQKTKSLEELSQAFELMDFYETISQQRKKQQQQQNHIGNSNFEDDAKELAGGKRKHEEPFTCDEEKVSARDEQVSSSSKKRDTKTD